MPAMPIPNTIQYQVGTDTRVEAEGAVGGVTDFDAAALSGSPLGGSATTALAVSMGGSFSPPSSLGGSCKPDESSIGFSSTGAPNAPPDSTSPVVSALTTGAVAEEYIMPSKSTMTIAGISDTNNCPNTERFERPGTLSPPNRPATALRPFGASALASGGNGTMRSLAASGGAKCGFHFATIMT